MFCDSNPTSSLSIIKGLPKNRSREEVINFIEKNIEIFQKEYNTTDKEKGLNQQFVLCMNNQTRDEKFFFHHEYIEDIRRGDSAQVDLGVITKGLNKAFFVLEAKRLDATLPKYRKKEYIIRDGGGGIERFKKEVHGVGLTYVGMIGYVQTDDFDIWLKKINGWIEEEIQSPSSKELSWSSQDKLKSSKKNKVFANYNSKHKCKTKEIEMYHIWIKLL